MLGIYMISRFHSHTDALRFIENRVCITMRGNFSSLFEHTDAIFGDFVFLCLFLYWRNNYEETFDVILIKYFPLLFHL